MPRRKKDITTLPEKKAFTGVLTQLHFGESYTSLLLGILVVIIGAIFVVTLARDKVLNTTVEQQISSDSTQKAESESTYSDKKIYTVVAGDTLWSLAEKFYTSGYNWVDIAKDNKLENPGIIEIGTKLTIPDVKLIVVARKTQETPVDAVTKQQEQVEKITTDTYIIKSGDYLWDIAVRAYGDGYKWVEIARANNLENPDLIFSGNELKLPRS